MAGSEMRLRRVSERDAKALLAGRVPASRPDLAPLAAAIAEYRAAAFESPARSSVELASRLGPLGETRIVPDLESQPGVGELRRRFSVLSSFAGLGLAAKIALGAGAAVAAAAGAGVAGVLPGGAQDAFDAVVSTVVPGTQIHPSPDPEKKSGSDSVTDPGTKDGTEGSESETVHGTDAPDPASTEHPENFGKWVSDRAKDPDKDGRTFGQETSDAAHENGNGHSPSEGNRGNGNGNGKNGGSGNGGGHGKSGGKSDKP